MSDGPHRSLPLRRHWKVLAERAAKAAYSRAEVLEALDHCIAKDIQREAPIEFVREVLGDAIQSSLLTNERIEQLEGARNACRGSALANVLIDSAIAQVLEGKSGNEALRGAVEDALTTFIESQARSIEEHYQREANSRSANFLGSRLDDAFSACDFTEQARELTGTAVKTVGNLYTKSGLDDGPELPEWRPTP